MSTESGNYIRLLGAEEVSQAARNICGAADQMLRASSEIEQSFSRLMQSMEEHARRLEAANEKPTLRRVIVSERAWVDRRWTIQGTKPATFLMWGSEYEEFENGAGNQSVAIVEFEDGTVATVVPHLIRFEVKHEQS